jgi:hypothetical protein
VSALRWGYMDHWQAHTLRGAMTQHGARRLMDDFAEQGSAVGFEGRLTKQEAACSGRTIVLTATFPRAYTVSQS